MYTSDLKNRAYLNFAKDGVPDFADGFDAPFDASQATANASAKFTPLKIVIKENSMDLTNEYVKFVYDSSDPSSVKREVNGSANSPYTFVPADEAFRIWKKDGGVSRDKKGVNHIKPFMKGKVFLENSIDIHLYIVRDNNGQNAATTENAFDLMLADVNNMYKQVGMKFRRASTTYIDNTDWLNITMSSNDTSTRNALRSNASKTGGLEVYCINSLGGPNGVNYSPLNASAGIILASSANSRTLAHEIGHACGLADIYIKKGKAILPATKKVQKSWMDGDWSGGTGTGFYDDNLMHINLIQRLIMYGVGNSTKADFPKGKVHGLDTKENELLIKVGCDSMNRQPEHY